MWFKCEEHVFDAKRDEFQRRNFAAIGNAASAHQSNSFVEYVRSERARESERHTQRANRKTDARSHKHHQ